MQKFLARPIKPFVINQLFGANKACISLDGKKTVIFCDGYNPPEGYKSVYGSGTHTGLDFSAYLNQPVYNACTGIVELLDVNERSGLDVRIVSEINGKKYRHIYEHLNGINVKVGDRVRTGMCIGWAGTTGYSSGVHLHFQLEEWINMKWKPIDPLPLMHEYFAPDVDKVRGLIERILVIAENLIEKMRKV